VDGIGHRPAVALFALSVVTLGGAQSKIPDILERARHVDASLKFAGVRTVEFRRGPRSDKFVEFVSRLKGITRTDFADDSPMRGQIVLEATGYRKHYFPDRKEIFVGPARDDIGVMRLFGDDPPEYRELDGDAVASRPTRLIELLVGGKVLQRMWIDSEHYIVLKRTMFTPRGDPMGGFEFTNIDFRPTLKWADFSLKIPGAKVVTPYDLLDRIVSGGDFVNVAWKPRDGVRLESARVQRIREQDVLVQTYQDGKTRLTLFQLQGQVDSDRLTRFTGPRSRVVRWLKDGRTFVAIGEGSKERLEALVRKLGA
jgi:hypothetical protein